MYFERQHYGESKRHIICPLVHSPKGYSITGAKSCFQGSYLGAGIQALGPSSQTHKQGTSSEVKQPSLGAQKGCKHRGQWLNMLYHSAGPRSNIINIFINVSERQKSHVYVLN